MRSSGSTGTGQAISRIDTASSASDLTANNSYRADSLESALFFLQKIDLISYVANWICRGLPYGRKGAGHSYYTENPAALVRVLKDSFQNTVYLERGMPYFAFVSTNAVLVRKIDKP